MKVLLFGASGMVGSGVLLECLEDERVESVVAVGRRPSGMAHRKLIDALLPDLFEMSSAAADLAHCDACFFCVGVSAAGMSEQEYGRLTYELTLTVARAVLAASPKAMFCYISGAGTDSTERGRFMWARVKGRTENALLAMPFGGAFMFRPGYIQPLEGVRSGTRLYRAVYAVAAPLYPVLRRLFPNHMSTSRAVGRAMIEVAASGYASPILEVKDINKLGGDPWTRSSSSSS